MDMLRAIQMAQVELNGQFKTFFCSLLIKEKSCYSHSIKLIQVMLSSSRFKKAKLCRSHDITAAHELVSRWFEFSFFSVQELTKRNK